jgi:mycothiol synthase
MDEQRYLLREFRDSDYDALATLQQATDPDEPVSVESLRHMIESMRPLAHPYQTVISDRGTGEVVGSGVVFRMPFESEPTKLWINGFVLPGRQREGLGSHLYDDLVSEAGRRGATALRCHVLESSAGGRAFLARRNFVERRRLWRSHLDVPSADTSQLPSLVRAIEAEGIQFTTLTREGVHDPEVVSRVYDLDAETGKDIPRDGAYTPLPLEDFKRLFLGGDHALPDAWFLAKVGDRYVGYSSGAREPAQPTVLQQYFTGVRPEFRRKRIALALKLMLIDYAKKNGYAGIETSNDSLNLPMWTLNRGLGFRKVRETIQLESRLR